MYKFENERKRRESLLSAERWRTAAKNWNRPNHLQFCFIFNSSVFFLSPFIIVIMHYFVSIYCVWFLFNASDCLIDAIYILWERNILIQCDELLLAASNKNQVSLKMCFKNESATQLDSHPLQEIKFNYNKFFDRFSRRKNKMSCQENIVKTLIHHSTLNVQSFVVVFAQHVQSMCGVHIVSKKWNLRTGAEILISLSRFKHLHSM